MATKTQRQRALVDIIRSEQVSTQEQLAARLEAAGHPCTQASVSRDIRDLGLVKRGPFYVAASDEPSLPSTEELAATVAPFLRGAQSVGEHLVVVHTVSGTANSVGVFMDQAAWPGLVGTVAGDDTIIAVVADAGCGRAVVTRLEAIRRSMA